MHLAIAVLIGILNVLFLIGGLKTTFPTFWARPGIETLVSLLIVTIPFAATALFAAGKRSKVLWSVAAGMNALTVIAMLAFVVFLGAKSTSASDGALVGGFAFAGVFAAVNVAYLIWRVPASQSPGSVA